MPSNHCRCVYTEDERPKKPCRRCRRSFDVEFSFGKNDPVCDFCREKDRHQSRVENPALRKAQCCLRDHSKKLGISVKKLRKDFGWDPLEISFEMIQKLGSRCRCFPHCHRVLECLDDISLDIIHRDKPAIRGQNTQIIHIQCNKEKSVYSPEEYLVRRTDRYRWETEEIPDSPQLELFKPTKEVLQREQWARFNSQPSSPPETPKQQYML